MYHVNNLNNTLTVATAEMPHMASVSVGLWVGVGSRFEPAELNGVCHFIEHMLFKGTRKRSAKQISEAIEGLGGYLNAFTAEETTCFHARAGHEHLEELLEVLTDMFIHSRLAPAEIDKERRVIKEEIAMYLDEPQHHVQELVNATLWPDQPLGRPITGTPKTLDRLGRKQLADYWRSHYLRGRVLVTAAGRVTHRSIVRAVRSFARHLGSGNPALFASVRDTQRAPRVGLFTRQIGQTQIALGIRTCSRHDLHRYALRLLNAVLGENMSSRLFQIVREDRGLAYSIYSTPSFFDDTGDLVISAGLETGRLEKTLRLIVRELRRLRQKPVARLELSRARDYVIGQMDLSLESTETQMNWLGEQLLGYGRIFTPAQIRARLARVTAAEIRSAAEAFLRPERLNLALVSPLRSASRLERVLGEVSH